MSIYSSVLSRINQVYIISCVVIVNQSAVSPSTDVCINYKHHSAVKEICLQACSEEAK